jgi:alpha-D-xyloside xylohydrolase
MKRLHPDLTWPAPYSWVADDDWPRADGISGLTPRYEGGELLGLDNDRVEIRVTTEPCGAFRLRVTPSDPSTQPYRVDDRVLAPERASSALRATETADAVEFRHSTSKLRLTYPDLSITLDDEQGTALTLTRLAIDDTAAPTRFRMDFLRGADGPILGLGGRIAFPDRSGSTADMFATKGYHQRGDYGGLPIPAFLELGGSGVILLNPHPHVYFDLGYSDPRAWSVESPGGPIDLVVLARPTPTEWTRLLHELTGRPPLPRPQWLGTWFSWAGYSSSDEYRDWMLRFEAEHIPMDVCALDLHWRGGRIFEEDEGGEGINLGWDPEKFGSHADLLATLADQQIDTVLHVNTKMYSGALADQGRRDGLILDATEDQWIVDLENPVAADWAWDEYRPRIEEGAAAWWIDNSERVEGVLTSGIPARNYYSSLWNRFLTRRTTELTGEPVLTLTRGGWLGDQTAALPWSGDTTAGVSRVKEDLNFILNLAMTGFPFASVDLGGFKEQSTSGLGVIDTDENVIRRIAHGFLFIPVPRLHSGVLTEPKLPWRYEGRARDLLIEFIRLRHRLAPSYLSGAIDAVERGIPLVRPLLFDFPDITATHSIFDEMLVARSLLIAPITDEGWGEREVFLPPGSWYDYWSGRRHEGGRAHLVDAPLYERAGLPVFVREGGILASRAMSRPREGFTELTLSIYRRAEDLLSTDERDPEPMVFTTPRGSRLTLTADWDRDELTLQTTGDETWRFAFDFPVASGAPRLRTADGQLVEHQLVIPPGDRRPIKIEWAAPA